MEHAIEFKKKYAHCLTWLLELRATVLYEYTVVKLGGEWPEIDACTRRCRAGTATGMTPLVANYTIRSAWMAGPERPWRNALPLHTT